MTVALATRGYISPTQLVWKGPVTDIEVQVDELEVSVEVAPVIEVTVEVCEE